MTGLGDVAYTGPADPDESTMIPEDDKSRTIFISASDVVLDGLTITTNNDSSVRYGVYI